MYPTRPRRWLALSLTVTLAYSIVPLLSAFRGEFVADSDARQHVFWMARFLDPGLFPNDWIADYHQFVAPWGYTQLYRLAVIAGIEPFTFNKLLPPIRAAIAAFYLFRFCREIGTSPPTAFLATLLLNQTIWMRYDITTGTARSFIYPLFAAFLFYLARRQALGVGAEIALQGLFYPQCVLISCGTIGLGWLRSTWQSRSLPDRRTTALAVCGLVAGFCVLLPYALRSSSFDPAIDAATARQMVEFLPGGRVEFFHENPIEFFTYGRRSGIVPKMSWTSPLIWAALLPIPLWRTLNIDADRQKLETLADAEIASIGLFFVAHLTLFRIHHPSRYTMHSLLVVLAVAAAIWIAPRLWQVGTFLRGHIGRNGAIAVLAAFTIVLPAATHQYHFKYRQGKAPELYTYLQTQPRDAMTATLSRLGNDVPSHARRSVLASVMFAMPYHVGYYDEIVRRIDATIAAQYTDDPQVLAEVVDRYGIDFWLLDREAFDAEYLMQDWLLPFAEREAAIARSGTPILEQARDRCTVVAGEDWQLIDVSCARADSDP